MINQMPKDKGFKFDDIKLELMDWKQVEQNSEEAVRKQMIDLEITKRVRELAKGRGSGRR